MLSPQFLLNNRRFLAFGLLAVALSGFGQTFYISLFGAEIRAALDLSHSGFGALYSAATLASGLLLISAGRLVDRWDLRYVAVVVVLGVALGSAVMAGARSVAVMGLAMFLLRFAGQGLMTHMAFTGMGRYFAADRGKAVSTAGLGFPLAEAVLPPAGVALTAAMGWRTTWWLAAAFLIVVALPLLLGLLRGHSARRVGLESRLAEEDGGEPAGRQWTRGEVLRDGRFYGILPAVLAAPFTVTALFFHQVPLAEAKGWSLAWLAGSFPAFAGGHVVGLLVFGPWVDRAGARRLLAIFPIPMVVGVALAAGLSHPWTAPVYLGLMGISMGATGTLLGALWPELYGVAHLGAIRAVVQAAMVGATAVAPALVGMLLDAGVTMATVAGLLGVYIGAAVALAEGVLRRGTASSP